MPIDSNSAGSLFIVFAPSGAGKSSLVQALLEQDKNICLSVSCTTRPPRQGEAHGREYYFLTVDEFLARKDQGEFLEWAEVYGHYYGTSSKILSEHMHSGSDVLLEIDWQGAQQVKRLFSDAVSIFILPPSVEELEARLTKRGLDTAEVIKRRIEEAHSEIKRVSECEYVIINQHFATAVSELVAVVAAARLRLAQQAGRHKDLFAELGIEYAGK